MNKSFKSAAQAGFTLIELIVVIVILGILAATALPKFADMGSDARLAAAQGGSGALRSAAALVHAQSLVRPGEADVTLEGATVTLVHGYPSAGDADFQVAAGLEGWTRVAPGTAIAADAPATVAGQVAFVPASLAGNATGRTCFISYSEPASAGVTPTFTAPTLANCQ